MLVQRRLLGKSRCDLGMNGGDDANRMYRFKGAYCSVYEKEDCKELFDVDMDVMADTLPEMAKKMIEASK